MTKHASTRSRFGRLGRLGRTVAMLGLVSGVLAVTDRTVDAQQATARRPFIQLLCNFADNTNTYNTTAASIDTMLNTSTFSLDGYVREMSYGAVSLAGSRAAGWFALPKPKAGYAGDFSGASEILRDCAAAAAAGGVDLAPFRDLMVFVNDDLFAHGSTIGVELPVGGQPTRYTGVLLARRGLNSPPLVLHELGHVLGGRHTRSYTDPLGGGSAFGERLDRPAPFGTHRSTTIGPGWDASNRDAAGWIPADRKVTVASGSQTVTLSRLTQPTPTGSLLVDVPIGTTGTRYVVSARTRIGYDAQLKLANGSDQWGHVIFAPGVVIELVSPSTDTVTMFSTPGGAPDSAAAIWQAGQTFTDASGIRISIDRFDDTGAQVTVTNPGGAPAPATTVAATTTVAPVVTTAPPAPVTTAAPATTVAPAPTTAPPAPVATGGTPTDSLAAAPLIGVPTQVTLPTAGFGREDNEPQNCGGIGSTAWAKVTAPASGSLTVSTTGSSFDTVFAVFSGPPTGATFANLSFIGCIDDVPGSAQAAFTGPVTPGATIYIQAGGYAASTGNLVFSVS